MVVLRIPHPAPRIPQAMTQGGPEVPVNSALRIRCDRPLTVPYFIVNFSRDVSQFTANTQPVREALCPTA